MDAFVSKLTRRQLAMVQHVKICRPHAPACMWMCDGGAVPGGGSGYVHILCSCTHVPCLAECSSISLSSWSPEGPVLVIVLLPSLLSLSFVSASAATVLALLLHTNSPDATSESKAGILSVQSDRSCSIMLS